MWRLSHDVGITKQKAVNKYSKDNLPFNVCFEKNIMTTFTKSLKSNFKCANLAAEKIINMLL